MTVMGMGVCMIPKENDIPCGRQITEGEPIGSVVIGPGNVVVGHKRCGDGFNMRKKEKADMVKIARQQGAGGPVDMTTAEDMVYGSIPLQKPEPTDVGGVAVLSAQATAVEPPTSTPPTGATEEVSLAPAAPDDVWLPEQFPALVFDHIPYTCNPAMRADPTISINAEGWVYIEGGNSRMAIPGREDWNKLVAMVEHMWVLFAQQQQA